MSNHSQTRTLKSIRETPPATRDHLHDWVGSFTGVSIAREAVCAGHSAPFDAFAAWWLDAPSIALLIGPRGGGKSFLSGLDSHLRSRFYPGYGTRVLGGSKAQSEQIYQALKDIVLDGKGSLGSDSDSVRSLHKQFAKYHNGSEVSILAASPHSVRGPHVPSLKLDEVDEIDDEIREAAMGMAMNRKGRPASVLMTSTWHKVGGPMAGLVDRAAAGEFPLHSFCLFEVLERCPDLRSGSRLEHCPACPLMPWCHSGGPVPKAKLSRGHYAIESAIQKVRSVSKRTFESDYLCLGPKADGLWFPAFSNSTHVSPEAEYDPFLPVYLAIDSGVFTGAVFFQVRRTPLWESAPIETVHVFADFLAEDLPANVAAGSILEVARTRCQGQLGTICTDPAGGARNPVGPTVMGEFERAGLRPLRRWPIGPVADGLALLDSFISPAAGPPGILIHPRCVATIRGLANYRRAKRGGQWQDYPEDPQHPFEDVVDALRGGLKTAFPDGRRPAPKLRRVSPGTLQY